MIKFWKWLRSFSDKQVKKETKTSRKCPNCRRWTYQMDKDPSWSDDGTYYIMHCNICEFDSRWIDTGFMGLLICIDNKETPNVISQNGS